MSVLRQWLVPRQRFGSSLNLHLPKDKLTSVIHFFFFTIKTELNSREFKILVVVISFTFARVFLAQGWSVLEFP